MFVPDANVLIYATDTTSPKHEACRAWLANALGGATPVGFAWTVLLAIVRLTTKSQIFTQPLSVSEAFNLVEGWLEQPAAVVVSPGKGHAIGVRRLLEAVGTGGNLVGDAHLAAIAIEHGAAVVSCDNDFSRFSGVKWIDPTTPGLT